MSGHARLPMHMTDFSYTWPGPKGTGHCVSQFPPLATLKLKKDCGQETPNTQKYCTPVVLLPKSMVPHLLRVHNETRH